MIDRFKFPPFNSDQSLQFENFCCDIFRILWKDPGAQLNGRRGQPQHGIDIFGRDYRTDRRNPAFTGVQCKIRSDKNGFLDEILEEVIKAEKFMPPVQYLWIATTLSRDAELQEKLNTLNKDRIARGEFTVHLKSWEDLIHDASPEITYKYFESPPRPFPIQRFDEYIRVRTQAHLDENDFQKGLYFKNREYHEAIDRIFSKGNKCLLLGKPASGKTSLALGYAYAYLQELHEDGREREAFYADARRGVDVSQWLRQMECYDYVHCFFIIDNCHLAVEDIDHLVSRWDGIRYAKILLVSREIQEYLAGDSTENYLLLMRGKIVGEKREREENRAVTVAVNKIAVEGIVSLYSKKFNKTPGEIGSIDEIVWKAGRNLTVLGLYIDTWYNQGNLVLSEIDVSTVLKDIYRAYLKRKETREAFLKIAALSQFEIKTQQQFVKDMPEDTEGLLDIIITEEYDIPAKFYAYDHSVIAGYVLKAALKEGEFKGTVDEYTFDVIMDYIRSGPVNFFEIFRNLYIDEEPGLQTKIFKQPATFEIFERMITGNDPGRFIKSLDPAARFLTALWRKKEEDLQEKSRLYAGRLKQRLEELNKKNEVDFYKMQRLISIFYLWRIDKGFEQFFEQLDYRELAAAAREEYLGLIEFFIYLLKKNKYKEKIKDFVLGLDLVGLGVRSKDVGLATIRAFIQLVYQSGVEKGAIREFFEGLKFRELGERSKDVGLATIMNFIKLVYQSGVEKGAIREFCEGLNFRELGERSKGGGLATIMTFIKVVYQSGVEKGAIREFCEGLNFRVLGERSKDVGLSTIMTFIKVV